MTHTWLLRRWRTTILGGDRRQGTSAEFIERKQAEEALAHQALHDPLTALPNRALLHDRLQQAILTARRDGSPLSFLLMDLDRFKEVNEAFGHHYGDLLLQQLAARLQGVLRESDTVARLGGDEFSLLLPATNAMGATYAADKLLMALDQPFVLEGHSFMVEASIGITIYPQHGEDVTTLLRRADIAMYGAKRAGGGYALYTSGEDEHGPRRLALMAELRGAIEHDQLLLHFQPKVDLATGHAAQVGGACALAASPARFHASGPLHPSGGADRPDQAADPLGPRCGAARLP